MTGQVLLSHAELAEVRAILTQNLTSDVAVWVFGSRAGGQPKPWSDLDLLLDGSQPLPLSVLATLAEAFDESALPWKVDLVDGNTIAAPFRAIIDSHKLPLPEQA